MVIALAGRRIDAPDAEDERFSLKMKNTVYERILELFKKNNASVLVSSAACGADLLAQKAARQLKIEQHIILPFERENFRETSVIDRPGDWGKLFDDICDEVEEKGNLVILKGFEDDDERAYSAVTTEILRRAELLQSDKRKVLAVAVWEGNAKNETDETASFIKEAQALNIKVEEISTK